MTSEERSINDDLRRPLMKFDLNTTQSGPKLTAVDAKETNVQSVVDNIKISLTKLSCFRSLIHLFIYFAHSSLLHFIVSREKDIKSI
jgi:hypothetical protein